MMNAEDRAAVRRVTLVLLQNKTIFTGADLADIKRATAALWWESAKTKFSPDQPRVPAGNSDGGQWTGGGGSGGGDSGGARPAPGAFDRLFGVTPAYGGTLPHRDIGHSLRPSNPNPSKPRPPRSLAASPHGVNFIAGKETFKPREYDDGTGHWTVGFGHNLGREGGKYPNGITSQQARGLFDKDLRNAETAVQRHVTASLTQPQFDALVSLAYNSGPKVFRERVPGKPGVYQDTKLLRALNSGDYNKAADHFLEFNKVTDKKTGQKIVSPGLATRRSKERDIFIHGVY